MTDAVAAAAAEAAPIDTHVAPIEQVTAPPAPLSDAPQPLKDQQLEQPKAVPTTREALRAAAARVEAEEAAKASADAKDPNKGAAIERDKTSGKFTGKAADAAKDAKDPAAVAAAAAAAKDAPPAKPATPPAPANRTFAAPERFSNDAKAIWDTAPEPVKAEVDRMHREMTAGIEKHRASAERFETIRHFDEMAARSGTDLKTALERYTNLENVLRSNPLRGLEEVCNNIGLSLRDVAAHVLGQSPDQERSQSDATIRELRQQVQHLTQQVQGVTQTFEKQGADRIEQQIHAWSEGKPWFEVVAPHMAAELQAGAPDLDAALEAVLQKHPSLAAIVKPAKPASEDPDPAASAAAAAELVAQTDKGSKSIKGAPTAGSEPAAKTRSNSIREALKRAAARAG